MTKLASKKCIRCGETKPIHERIIKFEAIQLTVATMTANIYIFIHIIYTNSISGFNIQFRIDKAFSDALSFKPSVSMTTPKRIITGLESVIPCPRPRASSLLPRLSNISTIAPSCSPTPVGCAPVQVILFEAEANHAIVGIGQNFDCNGASFLST